jgi:hypothetical protein
VKDFADESRYRNGEDTLVVSPKMRLTSTSNDQTPKGMSTHHSNPTPVVTAVLPPPGDFSVLSNASVTVHTFHHGEADERVLLSMAPGDYDVTTGGRPYIGFSTLRVLSGSLRARRGTYEQQILAGDSMSISGEEPLVLKTTEFTQAQLVAPFDRHLLLSSGIRGDTTGWVMATPSLRPPTPPRMEVIAILA